MFVETKSILTHQCRFNARLLQNIKKMILIFNYL